MKNNKNINLLFKNTAKMKNLKPYSDYPEEAVKKIKRQEKKKLKKAIDAIYSLHPYIYDLNVKLDNHEYNALNLTFQVWAVQEELRVDSEVHLFDHFSLKRIHAETIAMENRYYIEYSLIFKP